MNRYTFVVYVHPDGISTLENLTSHERVQITELDEIGPRIEFWLRAQALKAESQEPKAPR
jgi:hypothetical protein